LSIQVRLSATTISYQNSIYDVAFILLVHFFCNVRSFLVVLRLFFVTLSILNFCNPWLVSIKKFFYSIGDAWLAWGIVHVSCKISLHIFNIACQYLRPVTLLLNTHKKKLMYSVEHVCPCFTLVKSSLHTLVKKLHINIFFLEKISIHSSSHTCAKCVHAPSENHTRSQTSLIREELHDYLDQTYQIKIVLHVSSKISFRKQPTWHRAEHYSIYCRY
jgi:hypothetical protein